MNCSSDRCKMESFRTGELPECAPLANPFVPFQRNNPPTYTAQKGIVRGTMYPGLDLPFMGMVNTTELENLPIHELQSLCFAVVELGMYLDTHPDDQEAFELFKKYGELYKKAVEVYEKENGPLTQQAAAMGDKYLWIKGPWPWEATKDTRPPMETMLNRMIMPRED